jgi:glycerol-3-phosphate dehydrogenase
MKYDLIVIGGGVNGVGIARDAAGRGLSVALLEKNDLASATSSASSKLIHGGLRYLEQYAFRLVREALGEREALLAAAPHIIRPLSFVLPHDASQRPAWMIRAGLFLYDHLAARQHLPGSGAIALRHCAAGAPLRASFTKAFTYTDCAVDDARLVVLNAVDAVERGARIETRRAFLDARAEAGVWQVRTQDASGAIETLSARALVNAAGPWVEKVLHDGLNLPGARHVRLVKGSHIVVPKRYDGAHAYILQNTDKRVVFLIPYEQDFTLIGTTDIPLEGDPALPQATPAEVDYLCSAANRFLANPVTPQDVVWAYSGVRALYDDNSRAAAQAVTRDYVLDLRTGHHPPLLSVYGGKLTTYRRLAEQALDTLAPHLPGMGPAWTRGAFLPGGDVPDGDMARYLTTIGARYPFLDPATAQRMVRAYGTRMERLMADATCQQDMGEDLGWGLSTREVTYLRQVEFARTPDDILWRRSKLGLKGGAALAQALSRHLAQG